MSHPLTDTLGRLEDTAFERLLARLTLLHRVLQLRETQGLSNRQAFETVAEQFNSRTADLEGWVYGVYESVSGRTMRRWADRLDEGGLLGLTDDYGKRSERTYASYFDPGSPLRKAALHYFADHPECTASELMDELRRHVNATELPDLRTVQRFLTKLRS